MKILIPLLALVGVISPRAQPAPHIPLYEETFNVAHNRLELRNGATLGGPGTGVSGKPADRAYIGVPKSSEQEANGPGAVAIAPIAPDPLAAFTCTFWYYLDENGPALQVPLNTAGFMLLLQERGLELRIEQSSANPKQLSFSPGINGPLAGWRDVGRWIFVAVSWSQAKNTVAFHQGLPDRAVAFMRDMNREVTARPTLPRSDLGRNPETIGNTHIRMDRPLAGRMDNLRVFDRVLAQAELEQVRLADIAGAPVKLK